MPSPCPRCSGQNPNVCACLTFCGHEFCGAQGDPETGGEQAGFTDDAHPIAGLSVDAAVTRWTCTRPELEAALRKTPQGQHLVPARLTALADAVLARLPEASPDARDAEIARLKAEVAERDGLLILARDGAWRS